MRIALAGVFEEVNTFAVEVMGYAQVTGNMTTGFECWADEALLDYYTGSSTYMGGFVAALKEAKDAGEDIELVPTSLWSYSAGPTIGGEAYQKIKKDILDRIQAAQDAAPLDGVCFYLHGAGIAEGCDDVEGDLCSAVRKIVGPNCKMICGLDHHANVTDFHKDQMDLITVVKNYPHIDMYDVAYAGAKLLPGMIKGTIKPYGHYEHLPLLHSVVSTFDGCLHAPIKKKVEEFAKRDGIYEFSYIYGFPFADVPFNTATVNCWATSPELAADTAREFAALVWENRQRWVYKPLPAADAVEQALTELVQQGRVFPNNLSNLEASKGALINDEFHARLFQPTDAMEHVMGFTPDKDSPGPIVVADKSDNTGSGSPGDSTHILRELIKNKVEQAVVCTIRDPETVLKCIKAGVGSYVDVELGGKMSKLSGEPVKGKAYVRTIGDVRYIVRARMFNGMKFDCGPGVGITIGGVDVAVISGTMQPLDDLQMKNLGMDPRDYRIVVLKSANHYRDFFGKFASKIIDCDCPGIGSNDLFSYTFERKAKKVFPLDPETEYVPSK